jgi:dihydrolipoamide dehydrogenase
MKTTYDLAVVGGGPGGYVAAIRGAQLGMSVALVEKEATLGGTCLNLGCIPSKALLESSELYAAALHKFSAHGIRFQGLDLDLEQLQQRKEKIVSDLTSGLNTLVRKNKIDRLRGHGRLRSPGKIVISGDDGGEIGASSIIIATGSRPVDLPSLPFDGRLVVSSTEALCFGTVPKRLAVVGAGAIGLELGSVWSRLGSEVTVLELLPQICPASDRQMCTLLQRTLVKQGLAFKLEVKVEGADVGTDVVDLRYRTARGQQERLTCDRVLVAVGRRPCVDDLGLDSAGIVIDERGRIAVDQQLRTNVDGIYAIGDVVRGPMLAHKAEEEGIAAAETIAGKPGHVNYEAIPAVVYTWPELAEVGLTEEAAKSRGLDYKVGRYAFAANGRARSLGETEGMVKLIADARTDRLLGAQIVGPRASELIAELVLSIEFSAAAEDIARTCHAHPTLSEVVKEAALAVGGRLIHG